MSTTGSIAGSPAGTELLPPRCQQLLDGTADLSQLDLPPGSFHGEFLRRMVAGLGASAAVVWTQDEPGQFTPLAEVNLAHVNPEPGTPARQHHEALLRRAFQSGQPACVPPRTADDPAADNPTDCTILLTPIALDRTVVGLLEVWLDPPYTPDQQPHALKFLVRMARYASIYARNLQVRQLVGQQQLFVQLDTFAQRIHASLRPQEVALRIVNEGARLLGCDRLSVGVRQGRRVAIQAVNGVDRVEGRSQLIRLMAQLGEQVLAWGEPLVYGGTREDTLPPAVLQALDEYLAESGSKLLLALPLRDERGQAEPPRSLLLMECFEPQSQPEHYLSRLEAIGRHAASALSNAAAHRRIPLAWLGEPLAGGRERLMNRPTLLCGSLAALLALLAGLLVWLPASLKLEARGQLLPASRRWLYTPVEAQVVRFEPGIQAGSEVAEHQPLLLLYDLQLELRLTRLANEITAAQEDMAVLSQQQNAATNDAHRVRLAAEKRQREFVRNARTRELQVLRERIHADEGRPGYFWLKSPIKGTVLSWDFREQLVNRTVKPSDPLLRLGDKTQRWEVELRIPHRHMSHILQAFGAADSPDELDVDLLLGSAPTRTFKGKLARNQLAGEAAPATGEAAANGPVVLASVRLDGPDISEAQRISPDLLIAGTEVQVRINCRDHRLGHALFHGVWELFCEKVAFAWF